MRKGMLGWALAALGVFAACQPGEARGEDRYYVVVFGAQSTPKLLRYTHAWATFLRVVDDPGGRQVYHHSVSWLPATLRVRPLALAPEPGVNLDLYRTLDAVHGQGESVTAWGPIEVAPSVYERSLMTKSTLESGQVQYRAISTNREPRISNCNHAVTSIDPVFGRAHFPLLRSGKSASRYMARQVLTRSPYDQDLADASWLVSCLGLDRYPVEVIPTRQIRELPCVFSLAE